MIAPQIEFRRYLSCFSIVGERNICYIDGILELQLFDSFMMKSVISSVLILSLSEKLKQPADVD